MRNCACGCGLPVTRAEYKYRQGHRPRSCEQCGQSITGTSHHRRLCEDCRLPLCACGCGKRVRQQRFSYLLGHHRTKKTKTIERVCEDCGRSFGAYDGSRVTSRCDDCRKPKSCGCGCGQMTKGGKAQYVRGHNRKGTKYGKAYCAAIRKGLNQPHVIAKLSHSHANQSIKQTKPEKLLHDALDRRVWKFVGSPRLNDGSLNPSGLGRDLPVSADIVSRSKRIMIFVDGCYWHECPIHGRRRFPKAAARDQLKTNLAESAGWIVLRFWEHEVKGDLDSVIQKIAAA